MASPVPEQGTALPASVVITICLLSGPAIQKAMIKVFSELESRMDEARQRAEQRLAAAQADGSDNPGTEVHLLLDAMTKSKEIRPIK